MTDWYCVGRKVVCVDDRPSRPYLTEETGRISAGDIYTIRAVLPCREDGRICFWLEEIRNPLLFYEGGPGELLFDARRFRPLVAQDADISVFTHLLDNLPCRVPEDA